MSVIEFSLKLDMQLDFQDLALLTHDDNKNTLGDNENPDVGETLVDGRTRG